MAGRQSRAAPTPPLFHRRGEPRRAKANGCLGARVGAVAGEGRLLSGQAKRAPGWGVAATGARGFATCGSGDWAPKSPGERAAFGALMRGVHRDAGEQAGNRVALWRARWAQTLNSTGAEFQEAIPHGDRYPPRAVSSLVAKAEDHAWRGRTLVACTVLGLGVLGVGALNLDWSEGAAMALGQLAGMVAPLAALGLGVWGAAAFAGRKH